VGTLLGYSRVSTAGQDVALQDDALSAAGCWKVWTDVASGVRADRPQLGLVLEALQPGNTLLPRLDTAGAC
jgi:DNA invertase Pin-like site-specific DNA recombinase